MMRPAEVVLCVSLSAALAPAQKMLVPGGKGQIVQLHDASEWLKLAVSHLKPDVREAKKARLLTGMAEFARSFVAPPLQKGEDITPLADRWLVAVGSAEQQAWVARLMQRHLKNVVYNVDFEVRQFDLSKKDYEALVAPLETKPVAAQEGDLGSQHSLLGNAQVDALLEELDAKESVKKVGASSSYVGAMESAEIYLGTERSYIKDFNVEILSHKATAIPLHATVFDGLRAKAFCGRLGNRQLGVAIDLVYSEVEKPVKTFETDLGFGEKLVIELPASTAVQLRRNLILPDLRAANVRGRDAALCSFPFKGRYMVFVVRAGATN